MEENNEVMDTELDEFEDGEVFEVSKAEGFKTKAKAGLNKYGKKVAAIAAIGAVGLIGYAIGKKSEVNTDESNDDIIDGEYTELTEVTDDTEEK